MGNPFRRWLRSAEYRALDERISELDDLYTQLTERFKRWDSRQRQRAKRGFLDDEPTPVSARDPNGGGGADAQLPNGADTPVGGDETPKYTKEQLRAFARQRGLM